MGDKPIVIPVRNEDDYEAQFRNAIKLNIDMWHRDWLNINDMKSLNDCFVIHRTIFAHNKYGHSLLWINENVPELTKQRVEEIFRGYYPEPR